MGKYSNQTLESGESKVAKSRGSYLRIHFKHCREICHHISGMETTKAQKFMEDVLAFKSAVPFTKYTGGIGHHAQAKQSKAPGNSGRWPVKATQVVLDMLKNAVANAESNTMDVENLVVSHIQANRAPGGRRRTYRAHGRIGPYMSQPAHVEMILTEKAEAVAKEVDTSPKRVSKKQAAKNRFVKVGGGN
ncbi:hypothetical protein TrRE_jg8705 [Triparma retinervis]|uniref:50S ribosomal protein L22, chloroplastic n=2 Tax=Triparma TaxID=722752 RepID=A0A9W7GJ69_9STRA|nr:hypothetical protein TrRE_jg8705 [Triparma retinervis]GMI46724.1 hypothetical protein TrCOL_g1670 [Triparma columacea]